MVFAYSISELVYDYPFLSKHTIPQTKWEFTCLVAIVGDTVFSQHFRKKVFKMQKRNLPCMNSKSLFTTVFRNFQWAFKNRGYWPTTYIMLEAIIALLSFPRFCSHNPKRSWKTTRLVVCFKIQANFITINQFPVRTDLLFRITVKQCYSKHTKNCHLRFITFNCSVFKSIKNVEKSIQIFKK